MHTITAKQLHQETKSVLDELERGRRVVVTRNGRAIARLEPVSNAQPESWDDVMREVWAAQSKIKPEEITENPVLIERKRRRR